MDNLPSLSLGSTPWSATHRYTRVGGGGRLYSREDSLISSLDEVPLINNEEHGRRRGTDHFGEDDEDNEDEEEEYDDKSLGTKWRRRLRGRGLLKWLMGGGLQLSANDLLKKIIGSCCKKRPLKSRTVTAGRRDPSVHYPPNRICNQKYNIITFIPKVLFHQFKFFLNLYFLCIAFTQSIPQLRIGHWYTYWGPLMFVIAVTMLRELYDDFKRYLRDKEVNGQKYIKVTPKGRIPITSANIQVSDVIVVHKDQRIPADMILLRTTEKSGSCFIRTDQLDGETDWKLRVAPAPLQQLQEDEDVFGCGTSALAEKPHQDIYNFIGRLSLDNEHEEVTEEPLSVENTLWANTVLASGSISGLVIYTGSDTRSVMNASSPRSKVGLVDLEINRLTKLLFVGLFIFSLIMLALKGFSGQWYVYLTRYVILFSYVIPISLRVTLDMGKLVYSWLIQRDKTIPDTLVRSSTIPEELGRIEYLFSDKTGTLTKNEMVFRKLQLGAVSYGQESMAEVRGILRQRFLGDKNTTTTHSGPEQHIIESVLAVAICHNVTPVVEEEEEDNDEEERVEQGDDEEVVVFSRDSSGSRSSTISYQASSPDEIALVTWTESVGVTLIARELTSLHLRLPNDERICYEILHLFPFTSERKRMGIIVKNSVTGVITLFMKGADSVMSNIVQYSDWLEEECGNMAREGLRTLVVGKRDLTPEVYASFEARYRQAKLSVADRADQVAAVVNSLEEDLELLCLTGVEDRLQSDVRSTLELLRNAGIKVWMLTGDKLETAISIAVSSRLISRTQTIYRFQQVTTRSEARTELNNFRKKNDCALIITGSSLELCLKHYETDFIEMACQCPAVVCCRCSPTHKAEVVKLIKQHTKRPVCAIGDGGNDVSMIQAANVGIGIVGKEGKQASLAADFSITQFKHVSRLLVWHGRNCYKRSAALSQFVIHRGLIISAMQAVFSSIFYFAAVALYEGILMVGYSTVYTMAPVFSLVLDEDVSADIALTYPELYKDLMKGRSLSFKTFFIWTLISIYQGGSIMLLAFWLFQGEMIHIVSITFTALILTELLMVVLTIRTWHWLMLLSILFSMAVYIVSLAVLQDHFDINFLLTFDFMWKTLLLTGVSCLPLSAAKLAHRYCAPPSYAKLLKENSMFRNCCKCIF